MNLSVLIINANSSIDAFIDYWQIFYEPVESRDKVYFEKLKVDG